MNVNMNVDSENSNQQTMKYKDVVDKIRHIISKYHSAELIDVIYSPSAGDTLKNLIIRYINQNRMLVEGCSNTLYRGKPENHFRFAWKNKRITDCDGQ